MKKFIGTLAFFISVQSASAQFVHLGADEESSEQSLIYFNDGSVLRGHIKNNPIKNKALRLLLRTQDKNAFKHQELKVESILIKKENESSYEEYTIDTIDKIAFYGDDPIVYKKVKFYDVNLAKLTIDREKSETLFFIDFNYPGFERYRNTIVVSQNGRSEMATHYYYAKNPNTKEFYSLNPRAMGLRGRLISYFRLLAGDCKDFNSYLDRLSDKKSIEWKEMEEAKEEFKKVYSANIPEDYKKNRKERMIYNSARNFEFWFIFMSEKYKMLACPNTNEMN